MSGLVVTDKHTWEKGWKHEIELNIHIKCHHN